MYTILVSDTNELVTTVKERIVQRSKLIDNLHFLVSPTYKEYDMQNFTAMLEYILPVSRELHSEILTKSDELYKGMIEYKIPLDTSITKEAGNVEMQITFAYVEMAPDGQVYQRVRKTTPTTLQVISVPSWCDLVPDGALTALDQRLIQVEAMMQAANDMAQSLSDTKADNITYNKTDNSLQLMANDNLIGQKVYLNGGGSGIAQIRVDDIGNLVVVYSDGTEEIIGKLSGNCAGIYIPSMKEDIMTFTLADKATENVISFDIDTNNEWNQIDGPEAKSNYIWKEI